MEKYERVGTICIDITPSYTQNGYCYKNEMAFERYPNAICYIPEGGFEDLTSPDIGGVYSNGHYFLNSEQVEKAIQDGAVYTRNSMRKLIHDHCVILISKEGDGISDLQLFERFVDYMLNDAFQIVDWQYVSTYIDEIDPIEQWELYQQQNQ